MDIEAVLGSALGGGQLVATDTQLQPLIEMLGKLLQQYEATTKQNEVLSQQSKAIIQQNETLAEQVRLLTQQVQTLQDRVTNPPTPPNESPSTSYAEVARTPPTSQQATRSTLPTKKSGVEYNEVPYCTIDISRVEENEKNTVTPGAIRQTLEKELGHKCRAVVKDPRNTDRLRVLCQDEGELGQVKEAVQKGIQTTGTRVLRDQLYPIKVDNANRT